MNKPSDLGNVQESIRTQLAPHLAQLNRRPAPPFRPSPRLDEQIAACQTVGLLTVSNKGKEQRVFVHRWTATELAGRATGESGRSLPGRTGRRPGTGGGGS